MTRLQRLDVTDEIQRRMAAVRQALAVYQPGADSAALIELPKLALADAVLAAMAQQTAAHDAQLAALPRRQPAAVGPPQKRRRRA